VIRIRRLYRSRLRPLLTPRHTDLPAMVTAANALNLERRWPEAEAAYRSILEIDDSLDAIWVQYGHALKEQGYLAKAELAYREAIARNPRLADTYLQLGHVLKLQGRISDAGDAYRIAYLCESGSQHAAAELSGLGMAPPSAAEVVAFQAAQDMFSHAQNSKHKPKRIKIDWSKLNNDPDFMKSKNSLRSIVRPNHVYLDMMHLFTENEMTPNFIDIFDYEFYYYANPAVRQSLNAPSRLACLVHFCELGIPELLPVAEHMNFDPVFYQDLVLGHLRFTPANAYKHWLNIGLTQGASPNERIWLKKMVGKELTNLEALDVSLGVALLQPDRLERRFQTVEAFINGIAGDPAIPLNIRSETVETLLTIADYLAEKGRQEQAMTIYQRVLQHDPSNVHALHRQSDLHLSHGCLREAMAIYQRLLDVHKNIWTFINLAACEKGLGHPAAGLRTLRRGTHAFPADLGLQRQLDDGAREFLDQAWRIAEAEASLGRFEAAQGRLRESCEVVADLFAPAEALSPRPIRGVALVGNFDLAQCRLYRIDQKIEQLRMSGYSVTAFDFRKDIYEFMSSMINFQAVIFYRVPANFDVIVATRKAEEAGLVTFYEIDDLIFDAREYPSSLESYGGLLSAEEYRGLKLGVPLFAFAMSLCSYGIASTSALAEAMRGFVKTGTVFIHRNGLGAAHMQQISRSPGRPSGERVTIFYGSGTKAHKEDFQELVEPALVEMVQRYGDKISIVLAGHIARSPLLLSIKKNVTYVDPVWDVEQYWRMLSIADINLAVLKPGYAADCKSEIKWLEAAMLGIPSVVSETATLKEVVVHDVTGILCKTKDEWVEALDRLICSPATRRKIGDAAKQHVLTAYSVPSMANNIKNILDTVGVVPVTNVSRPTVVVVNVFYPPQAIGGATRVVHDNVRHFTKKYKEQFDVHVFTSIEGGVTPYTVSHFVRDGVRVTGVTTPVDPDIDNRVHDAKMGEIFAEFLAQVRPSLVHFHCVQRLTSSVVEEALRQEIPYLISVHDGWWISGQQFLLDDAGALSLYNYSDPSESLRRLGGGAFERLLRLRPLLAGATAVMAVSAPFAALYQSCGVAKVITVSNGLPDLSAGERRPSPDGKVRLGFIGGMAAHKGYLLLKHALYGGQFSNLRLLVVDHTLKEWEGRTEIWNTTEVTFRPKEAQENVGALYGALDVLVAPSLWPESYGLVTREALHYGCWVIASDRGSVGEYVRDGQNGFIVDVSSPDGLGAALRTIDADSLRFRRPPTEIPAMRHTSAQGEELAAIYQDVINNAGRYPVGRPGKPAVEGRQAVSVHAL
jgi:glycosyltransferase involved in cell wall biosynthesis/tetratricopeptide (TPR) repeat protein